MRKPSRAMPPAPSLQPMSLRDLMIFLAVLVACLAPLGLAVYSNPPILVLYIGSALIWVLLARVEDPKWKRFLADRQGDSICTFARALDYRSLDTWIIRAVYEEVRRNCEFPLRPTDSFFDDIGIDPDDVVDDIAFRAGRSMNDSEKNPLYGKVDTVSDLILFFMNQPRQVTI